VQQKNFKAMVIRELEDGAFSRGIAEQKIDELPNGEVLIRVKYSSLNYKDALSATGNKGVTKSYPHTPGIDAAGVVEVSSVSTFKEGDEVIVTGHDLGMNTSGGFADYIRVPAAWIVPLPESLTLKESMIYGTAGFTAGLCVHALMDGIAPTDGEILVTGATGGVGCLSIAILAKLGYTVIAGTGKAEERDFLVSLGASDLITREEMLEGAGTPMLKSRWAGVIDTVGGDILANAIKSTNYGGIVAACGNAASMDLPLSVFPFILRAVRLQGIGSQNCPMPLRKKIWQQLADAWKPAQMDTLYTEVGLEGLDEKIDLILQGRLKARTIVNL
jgi:putative YhdH/YhfP family quinone oxidoreductase